MFCPILPLFTITVAIGVTLPARSRADEPKSVAITGRYALLVGCTEYPDDPGIRPLRGPANDAPLWAKILTDPNGFRFPKENVTQLVGWPKDKEQRPTRDNIVKSFKSLMKQSAPGVQIVIVLSGHGTQYPIPKGLDPLDPKNPEPDGLDEVFLPADAKAGDGFPQNGIKDDDIGEWLDAMRERGAGVWIVFDSCHSGTMTRGNDEGAEIARSVDPSHFCNEEALDAAAKRASAAVKVAEKAGKPAPSGSKVRAAADRGKGGSVVAFYAAQPFEKAPELPLPEGVPHTKEHYYGLFSYSLIQSLEQRRAPISYRELSRMVGAQYRAIRGTRWPTPFAEGDLDREVLGLNRWPDRSDLILEREKGKLRVNAGELRGLTPGSVLAVRRPAGAEGSAEEVLGYVRVESAAMTTAIVLPVAHAGKLAPGAGALPDLGRCELVSRNFGDMRIKLFTDDDPAVKAAYEKLPRELRDMVNTKVTEAEAEWCLRAVTPKEAVSEFELAGLKGRHALLIQGQGRKAGLAAKDRDAERRVEDRLKAAGLPAPRKVFASYPVEKPEVLTGELERDLPKVFKWQNIWRVVGGVHTQDGGENHGLRFEVATLKDENDRSGGEVLRGGVLRNGQEVEIRLKNEGTDDLWVTVLYLNANLGVEHYWSGSIKQGVPLKPFRTTMTVKDNSIGMEGVVVLAVPMAVQKQEPDYHFLEQQPLRVTEAVKRGAEDAPNTPFGKLMTAAAYSGGTRDMERRVPSTPAILSQSWVLVADE